jgi:putative ATPase
MQLFAELKKDNAPLADRLRPQKFEDIVGQEHLFAEHSVIKNFIDAELNDNVFLPSLILWGVPGCGKTTLANIIAKKSKRYIEFLSAITTGVADLKEIFATAKARKNDGIETILFVDEIHRFNRAQQDVFLPFIENGTITLIGATTENPSFELNSALISRCKVLVLKRLNESALLKLIAKAEDFLNKKINLNTEAKIALCNMADGDGRTLLNMAEEIFNLKSNLKSNAKNPALITPEKLVEIIQKKLPLYDKGQDSHYNLISALHKSLRGSDVDAALYYMARMLHGGENPNYLIRRLIRFANEDIGLADPQAVVQAIAAMEAYNMLGSPEGELAITQLVIYLATAPKSNAVYKAYNFAVEAAKQYGSLMPPKTILNGHTKLMKDEGYGGDYIYDHDTPNGFSGQNYFPDEMQRQKFYQPVERGFERDIIKRLDYFEKLRKA